MSGTHVFISYRRADTQDLTDRLGDHLTARIGTNAVFKDVDSIGGGENFHAAIRAAIEHSDVLLAVIGPGWLTADDEIGRRRIDDPADFVRQEIELANALDVEVIPLLARGIELPDARDLPEPLRFLTIANALPLRSDPDFRTDFERVMRSLPLPEADDAIARSLITPVDLDAYFDDLVVPDTVRSELVTILAEIRSRDRLEEWGFREDGSRSTVLITGPPGTGKFMAAKVLADELGVDLYRYTSATQIGLSPAERLERFGAMLRLVERENAALAVVAVDSGTFAGWPEVAKRLLTHPGLVVLTTADTEWMSSTFRGSVGHHVSFELPDESERVTIWRNSLPSSAPLDIEDSQVTALAALFEFSGSQISEAARLSAVYALGDGTAINGHVLKRGAEAVSRRQG